MVKKMNEIWIIKSNKEINTGYNNICGFCLDQDHAFKIASKITLEYLIEHFALDCQEENNEDFRRFKQIEILLEDQEYRKAYYKCRDYFYSSVFDIEKVEQLKDE